MFTTPLFWAVVFGGALVHRTLPERSRGWFVAALSVTYLGYVLRPAEPGGAVAGMSAAQASLVVFVLLGGATFLLAGRAVGRRRLRLWLILGVLLYLALHKYIPPVLSSLSWTQGGATSFWVPLGISYFTFKLVHVVVDVGHRKERTGRLGDFLAYLFVFPAFTAGPIERWDHYQANLRPKATAEQWIGGLSRIAVGLVKKFAVVELLLRGRVQEIDATLLATDPSVGPGEVWIYLLMWYAYVYIDFSAYTDLAIGCAHLFGIELMENFNWPILAENIGDFWKRWHMTLANWCQTYVYLPMIGWTRNPYAAVFATFFAIGIWHGASLNWILWGLYHGAGVAVYLTWRRMLRRRGRRPPLPPAAYWARRGMAAVTTTLFVAAGFTFSATHVDGEVWAQVPVAFQLLSKCVGLG